MIHVAYCLDRNYQQHFGVSATSLLLNFDGAPEDLCIHVVTDGADALFLEKLGQLRRQFRSAIVVHTPSPEALRSLAGQPVNGALNHLTLATFYRLLLPAILPAEIAKVLYLDSDTVVLTSIGPLFEEDLEGCALMAVVDPSSAAMASHWSLDRYVNSGVMLLNLQRWREAGHVGKCLEHGLRYQDKVRYGDQCAINAVLAGEIRLLPGQWNTPVWPGGGPVDPQAAAILHYITGDKPWQSWYRDPLARFYWQYLAASPWAGAEPVAPRNRKEARLLTKLLYQRGQYLALLKACLNGRILAASSSRH